MACRLEKWVLQQLLQFRVYPQGPGAETAAPGRARGSGPAPLERGPPCRRKAGMFAAMAWSGRRLPPGPRNCASAAEGGT